MDAQSVIRDLVDKLVESSKEKTHLVIGNAGGGRQTLWPKSESPELYHKDEAERMAKEQNAWTKKNNPNSMIHWHAKHIDQAHDYISGDQPAWSGLRKLKIIRDRPFRDD